VLRNFPKNNIPEFTSLLKWVVYLRKLDKGRIAAVVATQGQGDSILKKHPGEFKEIIKMSPPLKIKNAYLLLSHQFVNQNRQLAEDIWNEIRRIRESGEYEKIADKYYE